MGVNPKSLHEAVSGFSRGMIWNEDDMLRLISNALERQSSMLDAEQAVRGIDCLTENVLRDRIQESFAAAGIHAVQERDCEGLPDWRSAYTACLHYQPPRK